MPPELSLYVLAGEPSGDRIGGALVDALRARRPVKLSGVGGPDLIARGMRSRYPMSDLSVMGFADVIRRMPLLLWRARQTVDAILKSKPDIVVLIDSQVFSAAIAKRLRRRGYTGPVLLYVCPSVWAWKPERALELTPLFDEVLAVLPFEPAVMERLGGPPTTYVGHPALASFAERAVAPSRGPLLLLPGSREGEINRNLEMVRAVAAQFVDHPSVAGFVLPTTTGLLERLTTATSGWGFPVKVVATEAAKREAFAEAVAAVAVSGTVTLELALSGVPMVATYVADAGQMKRMIKYRVKHITLPNILAGREVLPEMVFAEPDAPRVATALRQLLDHPEAMARQLQDFREIRALMQKGTPEAPLVDVVDRVLAHAGQRSMIAV